MDQLRRILANIAAQLKGLTATQKTLIGSLAVVLLMTLFLVSQYAGSPTLVPLIPAGTPEDQQKAAAYLEGAGVGFQINSGGKVAVSSESKYVVLAKMQQAQALPGDKTLLFPDLAEKQDWLKPKSVQDQLYNTALCNELARVIVHMPGIERASVFISNPASRGTVGLGTAARPAVATVTVFPAGNRPLDMQTVDALADLIAGASSGLDLRNVSVVDGVNRRRYRATSPDDFYATSYMEQVAKVEQRVQDKISEHLGRFISDVVVSVNAIVDASRKETRTEKVLPKGEGSLTLATEERTTTSTSTTPVRSGAEPGISGNIGLDINKGGSGGGGGTSDETTEIKSEAAFGHEIVNRKDAPGKPTKINVTVSVPRDYVAQVVKARKAAAGSGTTGGAANTPAAGADEPTDAEIADAFNKTAADRKSVREEIEALVRPLVDTRELAAAGGAAAAEAGEVVVSLIPIAMASIGGSGSAGAGGFGAGMIGGVGGGGGIASFLESGAFKNILLGGLAFLAVGMMFMLVRKAGKMPPLPTAEELVGIPPALQPGSDVVGEADEGETAMTGIEIDDAALKTSKMLEEVGDLVKSNPKVAATVLNRWLSTEE